jgi:predicted RNase H-like HicB family nuclease
LYRTTHHIILKNGKFMKLKVVIHPAEEGGFWAEVPAISGCATQGETIEELLTNLYEAVEACLSVDLTEIEIAENDKVLEIAV